MLYTFTMVDNKGCKHEIQAYGIDQITEDTVLLDPSGIMVVNSLERPRKFTTDPPGP